MCPGLASTDERPTYILLQQNLLSHYVRGALCVCVCPWLFGRTCNNPHKAGAVIRQSPESNPTVGNIRRTFPKSTKNAKVCRVHSDTSNEGPTQATPTLASLSHWWSPRNLDSSSLAIETRSAISQKHAENCRLPLALYLVFCRNSRQSNVIGL